MRKKKRKIKEIRNIFMFGACAAVSGVAAMLGMNALPAMAAEVIGEDVGADVGADAGISTGDSTDAARELSENSRGG